MNYKNSFNQFWFHCCNCTSEQ